VVVRVRTLVLLPVAVVLAASGCGGPAGAAPGAPGASQQAAAGGDTADDAGEAAPDWSATDALDMTVSFADGPALAAATGVTFSNGLGEIREWELVGSPDSTNTGVDPAVTLEMVDAESGCRVLDERAPFTGTSTDDDAASTALVDEHLAGAELVAGPARNVMGLREGLGEGGPTYAVARALAREPDGGWRVVTARAFTALGAQQVVTVRCPTGPGIDVTLGQLAMVSFAQLHGLERYP
jgi:hypothetical protein